MTPDPHAEPSGRPSGAPPAAALPAVPAAIAAFLRGIERRGAVLAELQCGDAMAGDAALAAAMRAFRSVGPGEAMARWPLRFWSLLLATPQLRRPLQGPRHEPGAEWLDGLPPGPRAAILLRLAAGLDEGDAAHALSLARPVYRRALRRALPRRDDDGRADPAAWLRLRAHVHRRIKTLPEDRLQRLARLREDALAGRDHAARVAAPPPPTALRRWLWAGVAACALALAATWAWPWWETRDGTDVDRLPSEAPADTFDERTRLLTHPDFALLADPDGMETAGDLAFLAWAHHQPELADAPDGDAGTAAAPARPVAAPAAAPDAMDALLASRRAAWEAMGEADRARFVERVAAWDALPYDEAGRRREQYLAWQALDGVDRALLRDAGRTFATLPEDVRGALRERYAALNETEHRGWLLGPRLGADFTALSPLLLQVPPDQREPLLAVLRVMTATERADLAVLAHRTPPQERDALRRALLETSQDNRAAWLRLRLER